MMVRVYSNLGKIRDKRTSMNLRPVKESFIETEPDRQFCINCTWYRKTKLVYNPIMNCNCPKSQHYKKPVKARDSCGQWKQWNKS